MQPICNRSFYWNCLSPNGGDDLAGTLGKAIAAAFGSADEFKRKFTAAAIGNFGSGRTWLAKIFGNGAETVKTGNAGCPPTSGQTPLFTCDV